MWRILLLKPTVVSFQGFSSEHFFISLDFDLFFPLRKIGLKSILRINTLSLFLRTLLSYGDSDQSKIFTFFWSDKNNIFFFCRGIQFREIPPFAFTICKEMKRKEIEIHGDEENLEIQMKKVCNFYFRFYISLTFFVDT